MILLVILISSQFSLKGQSKSYIGSVDSTIIKERGLEDKVKMLLEECDWSRRIGGEIDVFLIKVDTGGYIYGKVYEYILDCDNVRMIYWYSSLGDKDKIIDFMIENAEDESMFVVEKRKHLKN